MKDMLTIIRDALLQDPFINETVTEERIAYYDYGEDKDDTKPFIILIPMDPPLPGVSGSNQELNVQHTYQIDVQAYDRLQVKALQKQVKETMKQLAFGQLPEGLDGYFKETNRYVDARRYRGQTKLYDTNY